MLGFFQKKHKYVAIDIGATAIKLLEVDSIENQPSLIINADYHGCRGDVYAPNGVLKSDRLVDLLLEVSEKHECKEKKIITSVPAPSVFTKKQRMPLMEVDELREHIEFEAPNFIPNGAEGVYLDFHIIGKVGKNQIEVMIVAVKKDVVDRIVAVFEQAGMSVGIIDIDQFALQNSFELNYPDYVGKTIALVNIGGRYTGVNICRGGHSLFTGDVSLGGRSLTEEISKECDISFEQAEELKLKQDEGGDTVSTLSTEFLKHTSLELVKQLSYFWNASGADGSIDGVFLSGGASRQEGLVSDLQSELGCDVHVLDPFKALRFSQGVNEEMIKEKSSQFAQVVGLSQRCFGDRQESID
jgi:type IV pilus assembly protein PilM